MRKLHVGLIALWAVMSSSTAADAEVKSYAFTGRLQNVSDSAGLLPIQRSIGDEFSGTLTFDDAISDGSPNPNYFSASHPSITSSVTFDGQVFLGNRSGSIDLQGSTNTFLLINGWESDPFVELGSNPGRLLTITLGRRNSSFNDVMPHTLDIDDFMIANVRVFGDTGPGGPTFMLTGRIESLTAVVPEPGTVTIVASFLVVIGLARVRAISKQRCRLLVEQGGM